MGFGFVRRILERRTAVQMLSVALIVATWRGPVPCVHLHGNDIEDVASKLARHVRAYHHEDPVETMPHWHFHLVLPQDLMHTDDPSNRDVPRDPLLSHQTVLQLTESSAQSGLLPGFGGDAGIPMGAGAPTDLLPVATSTAPGLRDAVWKSGSFLTTLLHAAPLCAVTGVALC